MASCRVGSKDSSTLVKPLTPWRPSVSSKMPTGRGHSLRQRSLHLGALQSPVEVVHDRQEILEKPLDAEALDLLLLANGSALVVLEIGRRPEVALVTVLEAVEGLARPLD